MSINALHVKYRPTTFEEVVGHEDVVKAIRETLDKGRSHAFALTGPSGTGKTTLGRIIAAYVGCSVGNVQEVDAARNTGVDDMRDVIGTAHLSALGKSPKRVYIIDEAHMLSKAAWNSMLKVIEEPPDHVYWVFCSTEGGKIPATIRTRCQNYDLKPVDTDDVFNLLVDVVTKEGMHVHEDVVALCADKCEGSPRRALVYLDQCSACKGRKEAARLLKQLDAEGGDAVIDLCRALAKGSKWDELMVLCKQLDGVAPEGVRIVVCNYFTKALMDSEPKRAVRILNIVSNFADPYPQGATVAHLLISLGGVAFEAE